MTKKKTVRPFRERLRSAPVVWQHFILLAVVLALAALIQFLSSARYGKLLTENYLQQAEKQFYQSCGAFSDAMYAGYSIPSMVSSSAGYADLQRVEAGQLPQTSKVMALGELRNYLKETMSLTAAANAEEYFLYFPQYDAVCTRERVFSRAEQCFSQYITYTGMGGGEIMDVLATPGQAWLLPETEISVGGTVRQCLTVLLRPTGETNVLGVVFSRENVDEIFGISSLPEDTYFRLLDDRGQEIFSYGQPLQSAGYEFSDDIRGLGCRAVLNISRDYFSRLTAPTRIFGNLLLVLTVLLGLGLSVAFSKLWTSPLRSLLAEYGIEDGDGTTRNEFHRLAEILASSRLQTDAANQILTKTVLIRVLSGGVLTEREEQKLLEGYPVLSQTCRIAIIHSTDTTEDFPQTAITELVAEHLPEGFAATTVNNLETGVLLPDETDALHELAKVLSGVNSQLRVDGLAVLCGVSAPFVGVHSAYAAVRQARFSIPIRESSYIEVYSAEENGDERPGVFSWLTHERLYQAVMKNDREDTVQFIRALAADKYYSAADAKEVFYNVRFVVRSTAGEMQLPLPEADSLEYREEMRPKENFRKLEELVCVLFDRLHARQETNTNNTMENVVAYVVENFRNPDLSANLAATHFALPVKTVYAAVRDRTGMNMGDFLIDLRMKEAAKLLCTTQKSVDEIASECGYPAQSTFYRVFKKYYGESPSKYRTLH